MTTLIEELKNVEKTNRKQKNSNKPSKNSSCDQMSMTYLEKRPQKESLPK